MINPQIIDTIIKIAEKNGQEVFLVGGYIRDMILGIASDGDAVSAEPLSLRRCGNDYDLVVTRDAIAFSQDVAVALNGRLVILDQETQTARIICRLPLTPPMNGGESGSLPAIEIDISPLKGVDIICDLQLRDITINALAVRLCQGCCFDHRSDAEFMARLGNEPYIGKYCLDQIIDPLNGLDDLKQKRIQIIGRQSIIDDPLRLIRAVRFSAQLQFTLTPESITIIKELSHLISTVAIERIVYELLLIMDVEHAYPHIALLDNLGLLKEIIPEILTAKNVPQNEFHHLDVWNHLLQTLFHLEDIYNRLQELFPKWHHHIREYLQEEISGTSRYCLLKLASILHDIGKPSCASIERGSTSGNGRLRFFGHDLKGGDMVEVIGIRLKLSAKQTEMLKSMVKHHMRPGYLVECEEVTDRAVYRFFKATGQEGISVLLLSLADRYATMGPASSAEGIKKHYKLVCCLLDKLYSHQPSANPPKLITGHDLMDYLCLPPSPLIGRLLQAVEEGVAEGRITDRMGALEYARQTVTNL
ncbi:CCA tRNA nucleotidyltransferase [Candidatus Desantisbacteria bacterium]|nr:CCA tRNA nucleotidyltransferase [Candidatus Desantisbacteria bacterium]